MNGLSAFLPLALLAGCATDLRDVAAAPEGTPVALGQPVVVGSLVATPTAVAEDSRCPENARCVWAGRLVVTTKLDGAGWRETIGLTLGEPTLVRGSAVTLVSGLPETRSDRAIAPGDYRFVYEGG